MPKSITQLSALCLILCLSLFSRLGYATPALYKVEKAGVTSYLLGTVHVGDHSMAGLSPRITSAIDATSALVVEVNINALSSSEIQRRSSPFMLLTPPKSLKNQISSHNYTRLTNYLAKKNISIDLFSQFAPWAVMVTILQMEYQKLGFKDDFGIDKQVINYAQNKAMPIIELETLEQQLTMFNHLSTHGDHMLTETFKQMGDIEHYFLDLIHAWKKGDMAALSQYYKLSFDDSEYGQFSEKVMLIERNNNWIKQLSSQLVKQPLFIAVGALHLPEKHGLLIQLQQQGFTVNKML
ncbi:TraB/GumN family protein [Pseudoalteromonas citrea]|uniref:TraB/GumN family protein n=2 Tax=Pseudoalteromonas TaxID=53246 RepID=A0A5S3XKP6_9GAMM|nr:TraB/GumN family protein [Pseudoalteromonas citrea]TMP44113.1 TraB/GumN family protein [Pseudoalteromonas citrea]TMP55684.1 TraB/GumN family protein [Pseudoalteromonas citrea]